MTDLDSDEYVDSISREIHSANTFEPDEDRLSWRYAGPIVVFLSLGLWAAITFSVAYLAAGILS